VSRGLPFLRFAAVAAVLALAAYVVALGTGFGRTADFNAVVNGPAGPQWDELENATHHVVATIDIGSLVLALVAIVALALARERPAHALAAFAVIAGSVGTCEVLKPVLAALDPLGGERQRLIGGSFPSGHSSVAMSVTLALMIAAPAGWRPAAAIISAGYSAVVGIGLVLLAAHYPSDVIGAFLVTACWAGAVCAWLARHGRLGPEAEGARAYARERRGTVIALLAAATVFVAFVGVAATRADLHELAVTGRLHTTFIASCCAIVAVAAAVPGSLAWLLYAEAKRGMISAA
jgi:membrane-associated phospholipid phosphatase